MTLETETGRQAFRLKEIQRYAQPGAVVPVYVEVEGKRADFDLMVTEKGPNGIRLAKDNDQQKDEWVYYASWESLRRGRMGLLRFCWEEVIGR